MKEFLIYEAKVAAVLLVFYLFYRFLLKKETFHRFNRVVLVGTAVLSFVLPFCIVTIKKTAETMDISVPSVEVGSVTAEAVAEAIGQPWWQIALMVLFWAGAAFVVCRVVLSILSIRRIISQGETVLEEDGCRIVVTDKDIDPFSWMRYIVLSRKDYEANAAPVIAHEKAHVRLGHSAEVLLVDILSAMQWFNPAIWMLRSDLKEIHEFEADDAVLRGGANLVDYQYLLIRKAVGKSGYSVANSFNHSILKNRITMMSKERSPLSRGLRALYVLPIVCLCLGLQAQTVIIPQEPEKVTGNPQIQIRTATGTTPLFIVWEMGQEREVSAEEFAQINPSRISSMDVLNDQATKDKYGEKAANGVVKVSMKLPIELDEVVVVRQHEESDELIPFRIIETKDFPSFQGGGMENFQKWLAAKITPPSLDKCNHSGTVQASFAVGKDGYVKDVDIVTGVCEELDALVLKAISESPKWEPAVSSDGTPKDVYLRIPIVFDNR